MIFVGYEGDGFWVGSEDLDLGSAVGAVAGLIFCFGFHGELEGSGPLLGGGLFPRGRRKERKSEIRGGRLRKNRGRRAEENQGEGQRNKGRCRKTILEHLSKVGSGGGVGEW